MSSVIPDVMPDVIPHSTPRIHCIVAYAANRVMGRENRLPWHLPSDLAHFKQTTLGHPVLMGRRTWESLGRALPGRRNLVITRQAAHADTNTNMATAVAAGAEVYPSLKTALARCADATHVFIIGGGEIFRAALTLAHEVIATEIHAPIEGDVFFPALDARVWHERIRQPQPEENGLRFDFVVYERKTAPALSHLDAHGQAQMVDVSAKSSSERSAVAQARVTLSARAWRLLNARDNAKGEVLNTARIAGILAAKRCDSLIPLCHSLPLSFVGIDFETMAPAQTEKQMDSQTDTTRYSLRIRATCKTQAQTGVEMEALTACSVAALTVYDMCKAADKGIRIDELRLIHKTGGKSGEWHASA